MSYLCKLEQTIQDNKSKQQAKNIKLQVSDERLPRQDERVLGSENWAESYTSDDLALEWDQEQVFDKATNLANAID